MKFDLKITDVELTTANPLARTYAGLDLPSGHGDFTIELEARAGRLNGYAKPLFQHL